MASKFTKRKAISSQNTPTISFRFSKNDDEIEEVSLEKKDSVSESTSLAKNANIGKENVKAKIVIPGSSLDAIGENNKASEHSVKICDDAKDEIKPTLKHTEFSAVKSRSNDSNIDIHSKSSRRACSLDSDYEPLENESWTFLKDLKGKITKNIEECISKDIKGIATSGEFIESSEPNDDCPQEFYPSASSLPSESVDHINISPSVEATEDNLFSGYLNNEVEIIKSEKQDPPPLIHSNKRKSNVKPDFNMKLSTLITSRSFSLESNSVDEPSEKEKQPVITTIPEIIPTNNSETSFEKNQNSDFSSVFFQAKKIYHFIKSYWSNKVTYIIIVLMAAKMMPIPSAIRWFFLGAILSAMFMYWVMKPAAVKKPLKVPDYKNLPPLTIPSSDVSTETSVYTGWMNELPCEYNPDTYHVNNTHSVHIRLDGSSLRVSYPKSNIPKRAMFNERRHELASLYPRHHDITGASVELLPEGLPRKRLWSKKYPLCLRLFDQKAYSSTKESESRSSKSQTSKESSPFKKYEPKPDENGEIILYLFSRTDREKDDWYRRFVKASRIKILRSHSPISSPNISRLENTLSENKRAVSVDLGSLHSSSSLLNMPSFGDSFNDEDDDAFAEIKFDKHLKFDYYMSQLLLSSPTDLVARKRAPTLKKEKSDISKDKNQDFLWLNALIGRVFFDFLTEDVWADVIAERIQRKLSKIKLPNFIEELKITDKCLGSSLPKIHRASSPVIDQRGIWIDIDISYDGCFQMTLETKINLLKLKKGGIPFSSESVEKELQAVSSRSHLYDSEEDDTAESSSDEDVPVPEIGLTAIPDESSPPTSGGSAGKKLIRLVDKIAKSSYFQSAAKNKYIQRAMAEVSNTPLVLTVEIQCLTGTLALNIPPMPTDRIWYGFRKNPELCIQARPKLGCRAVTMSHIIEWIEKKLVLEFQKVLVMPNMDDMVIPIMHPEDQVSDVDV